MGRPAYVEHGRAMLGHWEAFVVFVRAMSARVHLWISSSKRMVYDSLIAFVLQICTAGRVASNVGTACFSHLEGTLRVCCA